MSISSHTDERFDLNLERYGYLITPRSLGLIVLPTEQCNFRCTYCYEDFSRPLGMNRETIEGIKALLDKRAELGLNFLNISWFGGEPLLAFESIKQIMHHSAELSINYGVTVQSDATTNGYLLTFPVLKELVESYVTKFQISFDGDKELHNTLRLKRDGGGTFETIWQNLKHAHESKLRFHITIRIHVNAENQESIKSLLERASIEFKGDDRFSVFIRPLSKLGGPNDSKLPVLKGGASRIAESLRKYADALGLNNENLSTNYICYAASMNTFVVRADGRLGKCTVALYDQKNTIGRLKSDGTVEVDKDKALWWSRGLFSNDKSQLACPLHAH